MSTVTLTNDERVRIRELVNLMGVEKARKLLGVNPDTFIALRSSFGTVAREVHDRVMKRLEVVWPRGRGSPPRRNG